MLHFDDKAFCIHTLGEKAIGTLNTTWNSVHQSQPLSTKVNYKMPKFLYVASRWPDQLSSRLKVEGWEVDPRY